MQNMRIHVLPTFSGKLQNRFLPSIAELLQQPGISLYYPDVTEQTFSVMIVVIPNQVPCDYDCFSSNERDIFRFVCNSNKEQSRRTLYTTLACSVSDFHPTPIASILTEPPS